LFLFSHSLLSEWKSIVVNILFLVFHCTNLLPRIFVPMEEFVPGGRERVIKKLKTPCPGFANRIEKEWIRLNRSGNECRETRRKKENKSKIRWLSLEVRGVKRNENTL